MIHWASFMIWRSGQTMASLMEKDVTSKLNYLLVMVSSIRLLRLQVAPNKKKEEEKKNTDRQITSWVPADTPEQIYRFKGKIKLFSSHSLPRKQRLRQQWRRQRQQQGGNIPVWLFFCKKKIVKRQNDFYMSSQKRKIFFLPLCLFVLHMSWSHCLLPSI